MIMVRDIHRRETAKLVAVTRPRTLCALCIFCCFLPANVFAVPPPAQSMFADAMAREQKSRAALNSPDATPAVLGDVRVVVRVYESIVQHYPASGYSDDALWQAGRLSLDAFARFGQPSDKESGIRLLKRLAKAYPASKLARQVPEQLAKAQPPPQRVSEDAVRLPAPDPDATADKPVVTPARPAVGSAAARRPPNTVDTAPSAR